MTAKSIPSRPQVRLLCIAALGGILIGLFLSHALVVDIQHIPIKLEVSPYSGFALGGETLSYGSIPPEGHGVREVYLVNHAPYPIRMHLKPSGPASAWLALDQTWVTLRPESNRKVSGHMWVPPGAVQGNYTGDLRVTTYRWWQTE